MMTIGYKMMTMTMTFKNRCPEELEQRLQQGTY